MLKLRKFHAQIEHEKGFMSFGSEKIVPAV